MSSTAVKDKPSAGQVAGRLLAAAVGLIAGAQLSFWLSRGTCKIRKAFTDPPHRRGLNVLNESRKKVAALLMPGGERAQI